MFPIPTITCSPGMYADVTLSANSRPMHSPFPSKPSSVGETQDRVLLVDANNRVEPREVKIGIEGPNEVEIVSGI